MNRRLLTAVRLAVVGALVFVLGASATAGGNTTYTPGASQLATITNGTSAAPWNESQGDPSGPAYASQSPGTLLPTYTPGGASVDSEPNLAVYPGTDSGTDGEAPYPSGTVGTPGPLAGYCGAGDNSQASAGSPARQPAGTTLPFAPAYFPHVVRNADGSLTGYFDYRPKDADEAIVAASSSDGGKDWTYRGEALEQNPGYCPSADINDDGEGHPNLISVAGTPYLYTLERAAGDNVGVGMLVHALSPTASDPLNGVPAVEKTGVDPDDFASASVAVPASGQGSATISFTSPVGSGPEQLVAGPFVDLTATPVPTAGSVITCTAVNAQSLSGCTSANGVQVTSGDLIEQVIATISSNLAASAPATGCASGSSTATASGGGGLPCQVPSGPNTTTGDGGLDGFGLTVTNPSNLTMATFNANAPNRAYIDGVAVYCSQANALPTNKIENCTTGPGNAALTVNAGDPLTADPIVPASAEQTTGLVAPDGIVGVLPTYPGAPSGSTIVMYTEKVLNYYDFGFTGAKMTFATILGASGFSFTSFPNTLAPTLGTGANSFYIGDATSDALVEITCTSYTATTTGGTLAGCSVSPSSPSSPKNGDSITKNSYLAAPGAAIVPPSTLGLTGEGSATNAQKLFKNNEDLTVLRVAYTTDGIDFSDAGLANGGIISGNTAAEGADYSDINNPSAQTSPSNLNAYATPGTADATEMRFVGSAGSIITNPDGSIGLFLSGAWAADGDSDAFNQIFYTSSTDGENWTVPVSVVSTDYTFAASAAQDSALAGGTDAPLGISAYYSGRAYGPSVVQNPDGTLTMVFAGYRLPSPVGEAGDVLGTNSSDQYKVGATDPALYRNILVLTLASQTSPAVATTTGLASSSPSGVTYGAAVTLTATVSVNSPGSGTPTGSVSFNDGGSPIAKCQELPLSGAAPDTASCLATLPAGSQQVQASYSGDSNYQGSEGDFTQPVKAATLTVTADNASRSFGAPNPGLGATITGFVNGDSASVVTGSPSCSTTALEQSPGGTTYPITCQTGSLAAANYAFAFVPGKLTVTYTKVISGFEIAPLSIGAGQAVEIAPGAVVLGAVSVQAGGSLDVEGAGVLTLRITSGGSLRVCGSAVGPFDVDGASGPVVVGDGTSACPRSTFLGPFTVADATAGVTVENAAVVGPVSIAGDGGGVTLTGSELTGPVSVRDNSGGTTVTGNTVIGPLTVEGNSGTVVDSPNTVHGPSSLQ